MKNNKKGKFIFPIMIFVLGIILCTYPYISNFYYTTKTEENINNFIKESKKIDKKTLDSKIEEAKIYNYMLNPYLVHDPYTNKEKKDSLKGYAKMLELEEKIGYVVVPKISVNLPIYAGTTETILQKGVGHMEGSSLPIGGKNTHTVLTAHTGLPSLTLFSDIDKLKVGDLFYINNIRDNLAYQVDKISVVQPNDFRELKVAKDKDYATLLTCTPYMINTHRLLVRGHRVDNLPKEVIIKDGINTDLLKIILIIVLFVEIFTLFELIKKSKRKIKL